MNNLSNSRKIGLFILNLLSKIATLILVVSEKVLDSLLLILITILVACLINPKMFQDFLTICSLVYQYYMVSILSVFFLIFLCYVVKHIEKQAGKH